MQGKMSEENVDPNNTSEMDKFKSMMQEQMAEMTKTLGQSMQQMQQQMNVIQNKANNVPVATAPEVKEEISDYDLEALSRKDYSAHMITEMIKQIQPFLEKQESSLKVLENKSFTSGLQGQVSLMRNKHKDFDDWQTEMSAQYKENSTLSVEQLYHLSRASNPEKVEEIDKKANPPKEERTDVLDFGGGMLPSGASGSVDAVKMNSTEAVLAAFEENIEDLGEHFR